MKAVVMLTKFFFDGHPRAGEDTNFAELVREGVKVHTCRDNFEYWQKKIDKLKKEGGTLSVRQWTEKPYRSPQETIIEIPTDEVAVSKLTFTRNKHRVLPYTHELTYITAYVDDRQTNIETLANNDGFTRTRDFVAFISPLFDKYHSDTITLAIINFKQYIYNNNE